MRKLDEYYLRLKEPNGSCMLALRELILAYDPDHITERWYYRLPCFFYKEKVICYIWQSKRYAGLPYLAFYPAKYLTHPMLEQGDRASSKILRISPHEDIPLETIYSVIQSCVELHDKRNVSPF